MKGTGQLSYLPGVRLKTWLGG